MAKNMDCWNLNLIIIRKFCTTKTASGWRAGGWVAMNQLNSPSELFPFLFKFCICKMQIIRDIWLFCAPVELNNRRVNLSKQFFISPCFNLKMELINVIDDGKVRDIYMEIKQNWMAWFWVDFFSQQLFCY